MSYEISQLGETAAQLPLTRAEAKARLQEFLPLAGKAYAKNRNLVSPVGRQAHVSQLSPALRRRLISEAEVVTGVIGAHGFKASEKFIAEVFWRTYWKGWLEQRPSVWRGYLAELETAQAGLAADAHARMRYEAAAKGKTGIDCFDAWMEELNCTGYLHNWARMQFASIWVFTLGLRWELGAELMRRALVDGDPASNTLSWRWVSGLHTAGKTYLASAERIKVMTDGRFDPKGLARRAHIPDDPIPKPAASMPRRFHAPREGLPSLLLLTAEDLSLEKIAAIRELDIQEIAALDGHHRGDEVAMKDSLSRANQAFGLNGKVLDVREIVELAKARDVQQIVTGYAPVGPTADALEALDIQAKQEGLELVEYQRKWDKLAWPHCTKGFFALKKKIPQILADGGYI